VDMKSTSCSCFILASPLFSWFNKNKKSVALRSTKEDCMEAILEADETIWIHNIITSIFCQ
jgi:hypothetical protein